MSIIKSINGGLAAFTAYFIKNYPGPDTVITDPAWHAPKIYRAAIDAYIRHEPLENMEKDLKRPVADSDVAKVTEWMRKALPEPKNKNFHTQLGCHFEEISELFSAMSGKDAVTNSLLGYANHWIGALADHLKASDDIIQVDNREAFLDSLCDQIVTASGVAYVAGMNIEGGFGEINRSNFSKFDDNGNPILDNNQKIVKGPNYRKPDLKPYV